MEPRSCRHPVRLREPCMLPVEAQVTTGYFTTPLPSCECTQSTPQARLHSEGSLLLWVLHLQAQFLLYRLVTGSYTPLTPIMSSPHSTLLACFFFFFFHMVSIHFQMISLPTALVVKKRRRKGKSAEIHTVALEIPGGLCAACHMFLPSESPQKHMGSLYP